MVITIEHGAVLGNFFLRSWRWGWLAAAIVNSTCRKTRKCSKFTCKHKITESELSIYRNVSFSVTCTMFLDEVQKRMKFRNEQARRKGYYSLESRKGGTYVYH
jgi:hypothetical protein